MPRGLVEILPAGLGNLNRVHRRPDCSLYDIVAGPRCICIYQAGVWRCQNVVVGGDRAPYLPCAQPALDVVLVIAVRKNPAPYRPISRDTVHCRSFADPRSTIAAFLSRVRPASWSTCPYSVGSARLLHPPPRRAPDRSGLHAQLPMLPCPVRRIHRNKQS